MLRAFKYRIHPTKHQSQMLNQTLKYCCDLYNHLLEQRKSAWETKKQTLSYYDQSKIITIYKQDHKYLININAQVLEDIAMRLDLSFKAFFRRIKAGEKPGYPRFKSNKRYDSITFRQDGFGIKSNNILRLSKIGKIKINLHKSLTGIIKTCNIKRSITNKWYVSFKCEIEPNILSKNNSRIGLDLGLISFITDNNGNSIPAPKFLRKNEHDLKRIKRRFSKSKSDADKAKICHVYERISNCRSNFTHQLSRQIINNHDIIVVEDLQINKMVHNHCLAKSIYDASWNQFISQLSYKAEDAGRVLVKVNPAYTSQDCSNCGHRKSISLTTRIYKCNCCEIKIDRDHNAAKNILRLGLQSLGKLPENSDLNIRE